MLLTYSSTTTISDKIISYFSISLLEKGKRMGGMRTFVIRRLLLLIPTLIGVSLLIFAVSQAFSPEQRAAAFIRGEPHQPDVVPNIIKKYHLDDPFYIQYYYWMGRVLRGDLGT